MDKEQDEYIVKASKLKKENDRLNRVIDDQQNEMSLLQNQLTVVQQRSEKVEADAKNMWSEMLDRNAALLQEITMLESKLHRAEASLSVQQTSMDEIEHLKRQAISMNENRDNRSRSV